MLGEEESTVGVKVAVTLREAQERQGNGQAGRPGGQRAKGALSSLLPSEWIIPKSDEESTCYGCSSTFLWKRETPTAN